MKMLSFFEINAAGYNAVVKGQKSYNGVAILLKKKIEHYI
jgi:exonuclease III